MPVLASVVRRFCVIYEVINAVNLEVNVEVKLSCLIHLDDPFAFFLSNSSFLLLIKHRKLG